MYNVFVLCPVLIAFRLTCAHINKGHEEGGKGRGREGNKGKSKIKGGMAKSKGGKDKGNGGWVTRVRVTEEG